MWKLSIIIIRSVRMATTTIHPGEHLAEELSALGLSAAALARHLKVPTNRITQILNGRRAISGDTALRLAHFFGTSAQFWMNLQTLYEVRCAQRRVGNRLRALPTIQALRRTA
jgi:addiction module HigA family antidote